MRLVGGHALSLAAAGLVLGLAGSAALTRLIGALLFGTDPLDPWVFGSVSLLLATIALLASWLPARRATRVDPIVALRAD